MAPGSDTDLSAFSDKRLTVAIVASVATLLIAPCPGFAGPIEDALGDVGPGLPETPAIEGLPLTLPDTGLADPGTGPAPGTGGGTGPGAGSSAPASSQPAQSPPTSSAPGGATPASGGDGGGGGSSRPAEGSASTRAQGPAAAAAEPTATAGASAGNASGVEAPNTAGSPKEPSSERRGTASIANRIVDRVPPELRAALFGLGAAAALFALLSLRERRRTLRAEQDALADQLTGIGNRQGFELRLAREWQRALRYERDLGIVMLDLDGFKQINDSQGHLAGDRILREVAAAISGRIRESDYAARLGGDEFVVLCPETGDRGLKALADGLGDTLRSHSIAASIGFAQREPAAGPPSELVDRADAAMYRRKRSRDGAAETATAAAVQVPSG